MKVGVPVISTGEGAMLRHALPTALAQDGVEMDVAVIDNGADDGTAAVAEELGVRCVRLLERQPWPQAMNAALDSVSGDAVLFMQRAHEVAQVRAKPPVHWALFRCHHVNLDVA